MKQFLLKKTIKLPANSSVATIGFFDGVHKGHRFLLQYLKSEAEKRGLSSMVISFDVHPKTVVEPEFHLPLLTTNEEKTTLISQEGIDVCVFLPFTREMADFSAYDFLQKIVVNQLGVNTLLVGYDHRFGRNREEGFDEYVKYGREFGLNVISVPAYSSVSGEYVSSSEIRSLLKRGDLQTANHFLGRCYRISGMVVEGHKIGRKMGFPTANITLKDSKKMLPQSGVYAVRVWVENQLFDGMMNIGCRPTFGETEEIVVEGHLFDYSGELYGKEIEVDFVQYVRQEMRFLDMLSLERQIHQDEQQIRLILANFKKENLW